MTRTVTAREANQQFSKLLACAEAGEETIILKRGQAVAKLVPIVAMDTEAERLRRAQAVTALLEHAEAHAGHSGGWVWNRDELYDRGDDDRP